MIETIFEALMGISYSAGNIFALVAFFVFGFLFGKLTRNVGLIKGIFALIFGLYFYSFLKDTSAALILVFLLGVAANHVNFLLESVLWAQDISDIWYAMRYRKAFEDIRQQETEQEERAQRERQEYYRGQQAQGESDQQRKWREQAKASSQASGGTPGRSQKRSSASERHYNTMGLNPDQNYSKDDLKRAYRRQAKTAHPDGGGSDRAFQELGEAYSALA